MNTLTEERVWELAGEYDHEDDGDSYAGSYDEYVDGYWSNTEPEERTEDNLRTYLEAYEG